MGFHTYCIVPRGLQPAESLRGLAGATVGEIAADQVGVWCSEHVNRPEVDRDAARAHNRVIESGMSLTVTPVPLRFGQWFDNEHRLREAVDADAAKWRALLDRFAGCVEFGLRVDISASDTVQDVHIASGSGREYMAALARRHQAAARRRAEAEAVGAQLQQALGNVVVGTTVDYPETGGLVSIASLVARSREVDYHATLAELRHSRSDLRFLLTGPWPPYSFVA